MDVYATQKIKATVKSVGSLILIVFYSSLIDFYYIGPNIHNILSELKFLVKSKSVTAKLVHKIFIDVNTMLFDTMAFFNGFNRAVIKDVKKHLSGDVIFNERLFINLRGAINSNEVMNMCRDYTGSQKYNELINSTKIKPKVKSDVKVREPKKYGDEVKLEKNDGGLIKFLSFKRATKRKLFLGKEMNIKDYIEYQDDYLKSMEKLKNFEGNNGNNIEKRDSNIMEVFDFINNVTNTDKDNEVKIKELSFWAEADENKDNQNKNQNLEAQLTFGFDFDFEESDKNKKTDEKEKKKDDNKNIQNAFDFSNNQSNSNNKDNKVDNKKKDIDIGFDFSNNKDNKKDSNKNPIKPNVNNQTNNQAKKNENNNDNKKDSNNKNAPQLFNFDPFKNNNNNNTNNQNSNNTNNNNSNNNNNNNQVMNFFDFGKANDNKSNNNNNTFDFNKMQNTQKVENKQNNNNNLNNNNKAFNFDNFKMPNNNTNTNTNTNNNNAFMGFNNMNNFNNQSNQNNQNKSNNQTNVQNNQPSNNTTNNNSNKNNDNLTNLLASFNFPSTNNNTTSMAQYIPSFPANNNNNNNNNNFNFNFNQQNNNNVFNQNNLALFSTQAPGKNEGFNFSGFGNNMMVPFQKEPEIFVDLKEQVCFYYNFTSGNKIVNAISKGYLGLTTESDKIKNKDFNIEFKTEKFKDQQYIQKDFDSKMNKINDLSYKIHFDNLNKSEKLLNYMINPNILAQNRILEPMIGGENNILRYKFMYNNNVKKDILKLELNILYKTVIQNGNMIKSDGNITTNNNNQIIVVYNSKINEGKIEFPLNVNVFALVGKITITVHLKEDVISEMNVEIKDNNQKILKAKKETQISYEFS